MKLGTHLACASVVISREENSWAIFLEKLSSSKSIENLTTDCDLHPMNVTLLKSKPHIFDKTEPDVLSKLKTHKAVLKRKSEGKRHLKDFKYRGNVWNVKPKSSSINLIPQEELLITVRIFQPYKHRNNNKTQPRCNQEILVLGQQNLCALRDAIACVSDGVLTKECSENPNSVPKILAKDVYESGFFFIEGTFYNDFRIPENIDYSEEIRKWVTENSMGQFQTKHMEETTFINLSLRLGYPYVYQHQGACEHLLLFSDIRLLSETDSLSFQDYPLIWSCRISKTRYCMICGNYAAKWITSNNERIPQDPAYFCDTCFKSFNYINGKKIGNFKAHPYMDISALMS